MKYWISHIVFAIAATATLTAMFLCINPRYKVVDEWVGEVIEKFGLERKVDQGCLPFHYSFYASGGLLEGTIYELGDGGVYFWLDQLESGDTTRTALALRELQYLFLEYIGTYNEYEQMLGTSSLEKAKELVIAREEEIAKFFHSDNPVLRQESMELLALTFQPSASLRLKRVADSDITATVRAEAVQALSWIPSRLRSNASQSKLHTRQVKEWIESYLNDAEAEVRVASVRTFGNSEREIEMLREAQNDSDIRVRVAAAMRLLWYKEPFDQELLVSGMNSPLVDKFTKIRIAEELASGGGKLALPVLIELIGDPDLTKLYGVDLNSHYCEASIAMSEITGENYGAPRDNESLEEFGERVRTQATAWWEKHKDEVLKESK